MQESTRRYSRELTAAMMLYAVLLVASNWAQRHWELSRAQAVAVSLIPMIGCIAALIAIMRGLRRMDEMMRRVQFDAIAFAFAGTALISFGWGFLEDDGVPELRAFMMWPIMGGLWFVASLYSMWRYR